MNFKCCALIPVYNHYVGLEQIVTRLCAFGLPCLFVDDGSDASTKTVLRGIVSSITGVECMTLASNQGKGAAVMAGFEYAAKQGYTHVLQVDADGQHDLDDVPALLKLAETNPDKLISGAPLFDSSVPRVRFYGRYLTHVLVWVETLSLQLRDSMCGFRVYPLTPTLVLMRRARIGRRMDFDTDIMVRLYWRGVDTVFLPTRVRYPEDGISHFRLLADNARMTWLHIRLLLGMLPRIPSLLRRNFARRRARHWAQMTERGSAFGIRILGAVHAWFGRRASRLLLVPVVSYFFITSPSARLASRQFLEAVRPYTQGSAAIDARPTWRNRVRHFWQFAVANLDMLVSWRDPSYGNFRFPERDQLQAVMHSNRGALLISAHLGNLEMTRALATQIPGLKVNALVYTRHAYKSSAVLEEASEAYSQRLIQVQELGPDTAVMLRAKVDAGEVVVIVGDRTPVSAISPLVQADFLGRPAPFAVGPWVLAHALECPVYLFFCVAEGSGYTIYLESFAERINLPRRGRQAAMQALVERYAGRLADYAARYPLQWYNFYDFWGDRRTGPVHLRGASDPKTDKHGQDSRTLA
ncbi:MAG: glycosyltransferase family 2 protein [Gammaproteobacteria bacterium]